MSGEKRPAPRPLEGLDSCPRCSFALVAQALSQEQIPQHVKDIADDLGATVIKNVFIKYCNNCGWMHPDAEKKKLN